MDNQDKWQKRRNVLQTMLPSKGRIFAADLVEIAIVFLFYLGYRRVFDLAFLSGIPESGRLILTVLLFAGVEELFLMTTGGTIGMFAMRIAYVDGITGLRFNHAKVWKYMLHSWSKHAGYDKRFDRYSYQSNPMLQRRSMQDTDTYFVDIASYNRSQRNGIVPFREKG